MILKNIRQLARTDLREDALLIAEAGYESIDIAKIFREKLDLEDGVLSAGGKRFRLDKYERIFVVGVGKGSALAALTVERTLGAARISDGAVIDIHRAKTKKIKCFKGTHPLPSDANRVATDHIINILENLNENDLLITIICGGGSALFSRPAGLTSLEMQFISSVLLRAGATIQEINTIRKHVSLIHGGGLAKYAYPATVLSYIISDVPGDDISMVSSGPTVLDTTTKASAEQIAKKYDLPHIEMIETPKDEHYFMHITNVLIASGGQTVDAMAKKARQLGYEPVVYSKSLSGLAKEVGPAMAHKVKPGQALLACGETQVIVSRPGKGGRNQDVVLSAIPYLSPDSVIISAASDGKDNVDVAGGIADGTWSVQQLAKKRLDPTIAVKENVGFNTLHRLRDHLFINKVTANISDFVVVVKGKQA